MKDIVVWDTSGTFLRPSFQRTSLALAALLLILFDQKLETVDNGQRCRKYVENTRKLSRQPHAPRCVFPGSTDG